MAAKPPKPPGNFLSSNHTSTLQASATNTENINNNKLCNQNKNNSFKKDSNGNRIVNSSDGNTTTSHPTASIKPTCNCSNISIMHLFHEMKQEFPTIPDQIVTQCVNENCHQRDNCIRILQNELALNPIPIQTYPAKVLQRAKQLAPIRRAPPLPPFTNSPAVTTNTNSTKTSPPPPPITSLNQSISSLNSTTTKSVPTNSWGNKNCDSVSNTGNNLLVNANKIANKDVEISNSLSNNNISDMPTPSTTITPPKTSASENSCQQFVVEPQTTGGSVGVGVDVGGVLNNSISQEIIQHQQQQRLRPTTLNLNLPNQQQQPQRQLRQQLNVQLQQHFQQRNNNNNSHAIINTKPLRKAPLPPIPPKPSIHSYTPTPLRTPPPTQHNSNTSLSSPISSGESEISVNVSLSSPTTAAAAAAGQQHLRSPVRHRSVITVQPEPPYTRDFLVSPTSSSGGSSSTQKSFTSVNLTLRQPNTSVPQSTIDISAGPGFSGSGTGLTYSSTSYDARRGCQKNFHITVTDEGGVFSASRIRPRSFHSPGEQVQDGIDNINGSTSFGVGAGVGSVASSPIRSAASEQNLLQQQSPNYHYQQQQQYIAAQNSGEMCLPRVTVGYNEILLRQRARKDKLATALRDNKKRLNQVDQEINILTEPVSPGESQRLDSEIQRLRCDCEAMYNEIENSKRCGPSLEINQFNAAQQHRQQQVQLPQPFPRQRPRQLRPPPTAAPRQPQLDFVQHHVLSPTSPSGINSITNHPPPLSTPPTYQQLHQQYQQQILQQQQLLQQQQMRQQQQQSLAGEDDQTDSATDEEGIDEEDDEGLETWACNMCTFRNHPQLNICECCENVRILPEHVLTREDIHITVSPGENRIVHSWIVS